MVRTPEGMRMVWELEGALDVEMGDDVRMDTDGGASGSGNIAVEERLRELVPPDAVSVIMGGQVLVNEEEPVDAVAGEKRKLNGTPAPSLRPSKRIRLASSTPAPAPAPSLPPSQPPPPPPTDPLDLWWSAQRSDLLLANSLPPLPSTASSSSLFPPPSSQHPTHSQPSASSTAPEHPRKRRRKAKQALPSQPPARGLLGHMNANIKTLHRVRSTHARFSVLAAAASASSNNPDDPSAPAQPSLSSALEAEAAAILAGGPVPEDVDEIDERPWAVPTRPVSTSFTTNTATPAAPHAATSTETSAATSFPPETREIIGEDGKPRKVLVRRKERRRGLEIGNEDADGCMHWMNRKVLEHEGFQGSSKVALDVLSGIASEFLMGVGRTMRFYLDRYSGSMTSEVCYYLSLFFSLLENQAD